MIKDLNELIYKDKIEANAKRNQTLSKLAALETNQKELKNLIDT
jgi:hypothetical protein